MTDKPRVIICGSREWADFLYIDGFVSSLIDVTVVQGGARGADKMARISAERHKIPFHEEPADWNTHGKAAGGIRNQLMLDKYSPSWVVAFAYNIYESRGTADMIKRSLDRNLAVYLNPSSMRNLPQRVYKTPEGKLFVAQEGMV